MFFNSFEFAFFLPVAFLVYWLLIGKSTRSQNIAVIGLSYFFYGFWDWRFLGLIILSTVLDFVIGIALENSKKKRSKKLFLCLSIFVNLGILLFFKYYNFFTLSFASCFSFFGQKIDPFTLDVLLPVGISFYTFQTLSYTIDVYRGKIRACNDIFAFSSFVCFFPQLVAGPIERAQDLLPQFYEKRKFKIELAIDGLQQILWGLFKKIVIADQSAKIANLIFDNPTEYNGFSLFIGAMFFSFQIYGDFSGYSDIAIGTSKLFGISLKKNFSFPYFSRDIGEFWRKWHISLSTWFKDYMYIPLGGSKGGRISQIRNIFIIFLVSGLWHGANWTYVAWGFVNALYFIPLGIRNKNRSHLDVVAQNSILPSAREIIQMCSTYILTCIAWIFFRAENIYDAIAYINNMTVGVLHKQGYVDCVNLFYWKVGWKIPVIILLFFVLEWTGRREKYGIAQWLFFRSRTLRWILYYLIIICVISYLGSKEEFIYFQF